MAASVTIQTDPVTDPNATPAAGIESAPAGPGKVEKVTVDPTKQGSEKPAETKQLAGKFASVEELEKAYTELQTKLGGQKPAEPAKTETTTTTPDQARAAVENAGLDMAVLRDEFAKDGKLSDASLKALEAKGISKATVDQYIEGQKALVSAYESKLAQRVGGDKNLQDILQWAGTNLQQAEIDAVNKSLSSMDEAQAGLALDGLKARFVAANGSEPSLVSSEGTRPTGVQPFRSNAELVKAMSDRRYREDPAYRADVEKRLAVTDM